MSRIGKKPVPIPDKVQISVADHTINVEGPLGKLSWAFRSQIGVSVDSSAKEVRIARSDESRTSRALHGLTRAVVRNMIEGVTKGYQKKLEIQGVGYIAAIQKGVLQLRVGYANEVQKPIPEG